MTVFKNLGIFFFLFALGACSSHDDNSPVEDAFDLSGTYKVSREKGSEVDMEITVINQGNRNDIQLQANRTSPFTDRERNFLSEQNINAQKVFDAFTGDPIVMGQGNGKENLSQDAGNSSQFYVCSKDVKVNSQAVQYCISGVLVKKTNTIRGKLILRARGEISLSFNSKATKAFMNQYKGEWEGQTHAISPDFEASQFIRVNVVQNEGSKSYSVTPLSKELLFRGEKYIYSEAQGQRSLEVINDAPAPSFYLVYRGQGNNRITIHAQIWSLGKMTGNMEHNGRRTSEALAYFTFKKK